LVLGKNSHYSFNHFLSPPTLSKIIRNFDLLNAQTTFNFLSDKIVVKVWAVLTHPNVDDRKKKKQNNLRNKRYNKSPSLNLF